MIAGEENNLDSHPTRRATASREPSLIGSATAMRPRSFPRAATNIRVFPSLDEPGRGFLHRVGIDSALLQQRLAADHQRNPLHCSGGATPGDRAELGREHSRSIRSPASRRTTAAARGCSLKVSREAASRSRFRFRPRGRSAGSRSVTLGPAFGDRSGLVEHRHVNHPGALQRLTPFDEETQLSGPAGPDHHRRGNRQTPWRRDTR